MYPQLARVAARVSKVRSRHRQRSPCQFALSGADAGKSGLDGVHVSPTEAWSRRVRLVGGLIQVAFAAFWLVRGSLSIAGDIGLALAVVLGIIAIAVAGYGLRVSVGTAPMPTGPEAKRIERDVTVATIVQLVASFAVPAVVIAAGCSDWVLPSIVVTIGPLLLWLDYRVHIPRYRPVGWTLTIGPFLLAATLSGSTLAAATGLAAGALLLGTAAGFHDLAKLRRPQLANGRAAKIPPSPERDSDTPRFRPFFNPATGEHITYTAVAEDSGGEFVRFDWRSVPGGVITEHIHPHQEERFTITAGTGALHPRRPGAYGAGRTDGGGPRRCTPF